MRLVLFVCYVDSNFISEKDLGIYRFLHADDHMDRVFSMHPFDASSSSNSINTLAPPFT